MGSILNKKKKENPPVTKSKAQEQVQSVDVVKSKLKISRDKVNNLVKAKKQDIGRIDEKIRQELPAYESTGNKKKIVPLLKAKKDLETFVENAEVRIKLLNEKLSQVEMQQVNADTIDALEDSNKYIKQMQDLMEKKDWQGVIEDAKNKYELDWPQDQQELEEDPAFKAMWAELGGEKLDKKAVNKQAASKGVKVQIPAGQTASIEKREQAELA